MNLFVIQKKFEILQFLDNFLNRFPKQNIRDFRIFRKFLNCFLIYLLPISDHFSLLVELAMPLPLGNLNALGSATNHSGQQSVGPPKSIQQQHFNFNPSQHSMNNFMTYPPPMNNGTSMHHQQPRL